MNKKIFPTMPVPIAVFVMLAEFRLLNCGCRSVLNECISCGSIREMLERAREALSQ